ncbi:MAG TPA: tyrosine-type recombinase/integrase [Terriglobia bacterium]|nr:tyrosine-type recombinase/integrase [Terriglobia bacterium]
MHDTHSFGHWIQRFLLEHLIEDRNLSLNTQRSYRDTVVLFLSFLSRQLRKTADRLALDDVSENLVRSFLLDLEKSRNCAIQTRNQRLSALRSLAHFVGTRSPEYLAWAGRIRSIPLKKSAEKLTPYLEKAEIKALLRLPDRQTSQGERDYTVLLFLYNTGCRADEAAQLTIGDLYLADRPNKEQSFVKFVGKGRKVRRCPLWRATALQVRAATAGRPPSEHVFLNRHGQPLTRFGIHNLVSRYGRRLAKQISSISTTKIGPHTIRHTAATHLLQAGVDINIIRDWLGHVSVDTTNRYARIDMKSKVHALECCELSGRTGQKHWREDSQLMGFLRTL